MRKLFYILLLSCALTGCFVKKDTHSVQIKAVKPYTNEQISYQETPTGYAFNVQTFVGEKSIHIHLTKEDNNLFGENSNKNDTSVFKIKVIKTIADGETIHASVHERFELQQAILEDFIQNNLFLVFRDSISGEVVFLRVDFSPTFENSVPEKRISPKRDVKIEDIHKGVQITFKEKSIKIIWDDTANNTFTHNIITGKYENKDLKVQKLNKATQVLPINHKEPLYISHIYTGLFDEDTIFLVLKNVDGKRLYLTLEF